MVQQAPWRYSDAVNQVVVGRFLLSQGVDPKKVLDDIYERRQEAAADVCRGVSGQRRTGPGEERLSPWRPRRFSRRSRSTRTMPTPISAWRGRLLRAIPRRPRRRSRPRCSGTRITSAACCCSPTTRSTPSDTTRRSRCWPGRDDQSPASAGAGLSGGDRPLPQPAGEREVHRAAALQHWPTNPEVDHLIGKKLSQKYRFAEGEQYQRQALEFDPKYLPATDAACPGPAAAGQGRRRLEAGRRSFTTPTATTSWPTTWSRCRRTSPSSARWKKTASSCGWTPARRRFTAGACSTCLKRARQELCAQVRRRARPADHRRDVSPAAGLCDPHVRPAGRGGVSGRLLRHGDHGQQPRLAEAPARRAGRRRCGTSSATSSRSARRTTRCRAG